MAIAKLFSHGGSQAVRLPKEFRFNGREVYVRRVGDDVILSARPAMDADALIQAIESFEPDIHLVRDQPDEQERSPIRPRR